MDLTLSWDVWLLALEQALEQGELPDLPVKVVWHTGEVRVIEEAAIRYGPGGSIEGVELIKWSVQIPKGQAVEIAPIRKILEQRVCSALGVPPELTGGPPDAQK